MGLNLRLFSAQGDRPLVSTAEGIVVDGFLDCIVAADHHSRTAEVVGDALVAIVFVNLSYHCFYYNNQKPP